MREKDHLDRMLDSSLSNYGDPGANSGLAERILAQVSSGRSLHRSAPRRSNHLLLWVALPAAACLLLTLLLLKSSGPPAAHQSAGLSPAASTNSGSKAPRVETVRAPAPKAIIRMQHRPSANVAESAARPKLDVFPLPQPLTAEEQALYTFATRVPEQQRQAILAAQRNDDAPLNVAAIKIQPLEMPDTGNN